MSRIGHRFRHGLVLGAWMGALCLLGELVLAWPPMQQLAAAARWLPAYAGAGGTLGVLAASLAPWIAPRAARERGPGLLIFSTTLAFGGAALILLPAMLAKQPPAFAMLVLILGCASGVHLLGAAAAASRRAWVFDSLFSTLFAAVGLTLLSATALGVGTERGEQELISSASANRLAPDVVVVVLEGVHADRLGCYGSFRATCPRLDALAEESVLFEQAFAASSTHELALAGLTADGRLATALRERGYRTWAGSTTALMADSPHSEAFGAFEWREDGSKPPIAARLRLARVRAAWRGEGLGLPAASDDELVDRALTWLARGAANTPYGMVLHLAESGPPHDPPAALRARFRPENLSDAQFEEARGAQDLEWLRRAESGERIPSPVEVSVLAALHDAEIFAADTRLGKLVDGLQALGLLETTLLVITSDHGQRFGEEGGRLGNQGSAHDAVLRVPLLIRLPSLLAAGSRARGMVSLEDLAPGVIAWLDGRSDSVLVKAAQGEVPRAGIRARIHSAAGERWLLRDSSEKILVNDSGEPLAAGDLRTNPDEAFLTQPLREAPEGLRRLRERAAALLRESTEQWQANAWLVVPPGGRFDGSAPLRPGG